MRAHPYDDLVVLDVTASQQLVDQYIDFASHGFHVISANKLAGASDSDQSPRSTTPSKKPGVTGSTMLPSERACGSTVPVRDLIDSGDTILSISGIFSGLFLAVPAIRR